MADARRKHLSATILAGAGLLLALASPLILIGIAVLEQTLIGTSYSTTLYDLLGIRDALQALYELLFPYP